MPESRPTSSASASSSGSAHRMILDHILTYPGTYELPLRTMYALNSAPHQARSNPIKGAPHDARTDAVKQLTSSLMAELSQLSSQQNTLPPSFITSFVGKCFPSELRLVDFPQALTGLDYLKDLEIRRCRELKAALARLDIDTKNCDNAAELLRDRYPAAWEWNRTLASKVRKVEALYSQLHIALRRWILINEMSLVPYSKHNCVAMLNTVYPPVASGQLPPNLDAAMLKVQRDGFFKYIQAVEKQGPAVLSELIAHGKRPGEETGWPATCEILCKYLAAANSMIDEATSIMDINEYTQLNAQEARRKADSGVDFLASRKSSSSSEKSLKELERPLSRQHKSSSKLEKLAREFRHMRRAKTDVSEMIKSMDAADDDSAVSPTEAAPPPSGTLRKMKSFSSMGLRSKASRRDLADAAKKQSLPKFDAETMRKQEAYQVHMLAAACV